MKSEINLNFHFTYGKLKQIADNMVQLIDRDIAEFTDRGYTPARRAELVAQINTFINTPSDEQLDGLKQVATENKSLARQNLEIEMRKVISIVKLSFPNSPAHQQEFGNFDLSHCTDEELVRNANIMKASATTYLSTLAAEGLTAAKISQLGTLAQTLDNAIDAQTQAINKRNITTEKRRTEANKLFDLISKYSETGKAIFADVSYAKYNDYVIYNTTTGESDTPAPTDTNPI